MDLPSLPVLDGLRAARELTWLNPSLTRAGIALPKLEIGATDVEDARARLERFAPFIMKRFPETALLGGLIESPLSEAPAMGERLLGEGRGRLFLKRDSELPIAGSIKARGGIYEVLKHAEGLAVSGGLLGAGESYAKLCSPEAREFFSHYRVQVGSTGNLGLSIGIISAALGFRVTVHMSADAKLWKKELLRKNGVEVVEYAGDYSAAVAEGRRRSDADPSSHFVDDENSRDLFMGYAVAAGRLKAQLDQAGVEVDSEHPLFVYIPCGVGGGPGGVAFGLKLIYGDDAHVFFVEPVQAPCMLLGMATGLDNAICVEDIGLSGKTHADGLAVGRPSGFVGGVMRNLLSGEFTVSDAALYDYMRLLNAAEGRFAEPSSCAAFAGPERLFTSDEGQAYIKTHGLEAHMKNSAHIAWLTGGALVPADVRAQYEATHL